MKNRLKQFFSYIQYQDQEEKQYHFTLPETQEEKAKLNTFQEDKSLSSSVSDSLEPKDIFPSIDVNLEALKTRYNIMINSDIMIREFSLTAKDKQYKAFLFYIDGMVNTDSINHFILDPLMLRNKANTFQNTDQMMVKEALTSNIVIRKVKKFDLAEYVYTHLVPQNSVNKVTTFDEVASGVNSGNCALFIDTLNIAFDIDVKGFKQRGVDKPENEIVIRGSQEAFTEAIRTNTSLMRRIVNNENLIIENLEVGKLSQTKCAVCYIKNIANNDLVAEVKYRLNNVDIDYLTSSGQLEQLIEDNGKYSLPQMIATERPDKTGNHLLEGRVAIIVNGSPYVLIAPGTLIDFLSSPEDYNLKYQFTNLLKFLRILSVLITLLLPGIYMAITNFHQELIPTELLFSIVATRESVPFPIIFELVVMEISFELIREAGLRIPAPIGPTIGIIRCPYFRSSSR